MTNKPHAPASRHLGVLDGWRAMSILFVLAGHMLPLGLKPWQFNETVAAAGMALFFTLSGFLITTSLLRRPDVVPFLIKRVTRIVPLAWLYVAIFILAAGAAMPIVFANLFFYANSSQRFLAYGPHLWSLAVEMQFYAGVALLVFVTGRRGLFVLPVAAVAVTLSRAWTGLDFSIVTVLRIDEILAGACLALLFARLPPARKPGPNVTLPVCLGLAALLICTYQPLRQAVPAVSLARPYLAAFLVGMTLIGDGPLVGTLRCRPFRYIATISYALYVIHPTTMLGWLGSGGVLERYAKRMLSLALTFAGAHASTYYFERPITEWGHRMAKRFGTPRHTTPLEPSSSGAKRTQTKS